MFGVLSAAMPHGAIALIDTFRTASEFRCGETVYGDVVISDGSLLGQQDSGVVEITNGKVTTIIGNIEIIFSHISWLGYMLSDDFD